MRLFPKNEFIRLPEGIERGGSCVFMGCLILIFLFPALIFLFWVTGFIMNLAVGAGWGE